jgi:NAD(P)-dependent dehydrogenase (short-subunit alcohol dehydrogenase family)
MVTGAASGIGAASARALAAAGAQVAVADIDAEGAEAVAAALRRDGAQAIAVAVDVSDEDQVAAAIETTADAFGAIDILHNNAAAVGPEHLGRDGAIHELDLALWDRTMAVNLRGCFLGTKHVLPRMLEAGGGVIINTASVAGYFAEGVRPSYGASKAAIYGFTRNVATQYGQRGIRCVAVAPGMVMTPAADQVPEQFIDMMRRHTLAPELARPEDIANVVVFLASDGARFINGATIPVDGGLSIHAPMYADEQEILRALGSASWEQEA